MSDKRSTKFQLPWDLTGSKKSRKQCWVIKKGKEQITFCKIKNENRVFSLQKDNERSLTIESLQAREIYKRLIENGYKLQK